MVSAEAHRWIRWAVEETIAVGAGLLPKPGHWDLNLDRALLALIQRSGRRALEGLTGRDGAMWGVVVLVDEALTERGEEDVRLRALAASFLADPYDVTRAAIELARLDARVFWAKDIVTGRADIDGRPL